MPSMWGATAAGAGEGIDALLERLLKESQVSEVGRHNVAMEGLQGQQIDESAAMRQLTQQGLEAERLRAGEDRDNTRLSTAVGRRPDMAPVSAHEHDKELAAGVSTEGNYKAKLPAPTQGISPSEPGQDVDILDAETIKTNPMSYGWDARDTNAQRAPVNRQRDTMLLDGKPVDVFIDPSPNGRITTPAGEDVTDRVKHYEKPPAPDRTLVVTDQGYRTRPDVISDLNAGGTVAPQQTAQTRAMGEGAAMLKPHVSELAADAQELDKRGLFGPIAGRLRDIMSKYGTTLDSDNPDEAAKAWGAMGTDIANDPALNNDRLVGRFATELGLMASGAGRVHGGARGGGSAQMLAYFKQLLSGTSTLPMFLGRLDGLDRYLATYSGAKGVSSSKPGAAEPEGDDPLGLLGPKK